MKVLTKRLLEMLTEKDKETLNSLIGLIEQAGYSNIIISDPVIINSEGEFKNNVLICTDKVHVDNISVLAYYVSNNSEELNTAIGILRPDVRKYITSSSIKYKPMVSKYSYRLPSVINCWDKIEEV